MKCDGSAEGCNCLLLVSALWIFTSSCSGLEISSSCFCISCGSLLPAPNCTNEQSARDTACLCSSCSLKQPVLLQLKSRDKTPIEVNENMGEPTSHMVPVNHVLKKHLIYFHCDHVFGIKNITC